jgi:GntR family transcriptional regulator
MSFEFDENLPIYMQIMDYIKKKIIKGEIKGGDKLPSVRELSTELTVNPNTISRAYQELEREGLTFTQRGMGTFITEDSNNIYDLKKSMATELVSKFVSQIRELGFNNEEVLKVIQEAMVKGE